MVSPAYRRDDESVREFRRLRQRCWMALGGLILLGVVMPIASFITLGVMAGMTPRGLARFVIGWLVVSLFVWPIYNEIRGRILRCPSCSDPIGPPWDRCAGCRLELT